MEKRVLVKNTTDRRNVRVRLNHEVGTAVNIGEQSGAVYYEDQELGMCLAKPMVINCVGGEEETQCVSLVGLYDIFIDGKRVGRAMTQDDIIERVNAGSYGVTVLPCVTISCADAPTETNCLTLDGRWDVELNGTRVGSNLTGPQIMELFKDGSELETVSCNAFDCVSSGKYSIALNDIDSAVELLPGLSIAVIFEHKGEGSTTVNDYMYYFDRDAIYRQHTTGGTYRSTFQSREESDESWDKMILLDFLADAAEQVSIQTDPPNYRPDSTDYCVDGVQLFEMTISACNYHAFDGSSYYYFGGYQLDLSGLNNSCSITLHTGADYSVPVKLEPFIFDKTQDKLVTELAMLNHFKAQIEAYDPVAVCTVIDEPQRYIPPAYGYKSPAVNSRHLRIHTHKQYGITASIQPTGTMVSPNQTNINNGYGALDTGLLIDGWYRGSVEFFRLIGCVYGVRSAEEVNYRLLISGDESVQPPRAIWRPYAEAHQGRFVPMEQYGIEPTDKVIDIFDVIPTLDPEEIIVACGTWHTPLE